MDLSDLQPADVSSLTEVSEEALLVLRKGGGKNGKKGRKGKGGKGDKGKDKGNTGKDKDRLQRIQGACWNCNVVGHTAAECWQPVRAGLKSFEDGDADEESEDESSDGDGIGMVGVG